MTDSTQDEGKDGFSESVSVTEEEVGVASRDALPDTEGLSDPAEQPSQQKEAEEKSDATDAAAPDPAKDRGLEPDASTRRSNPEKRINTLTRRLTEAEREKAYLRGRLEALESRPAGQAVEAPAEGADDGRPKIDDYDTAEDFADALADWKVEHPEARKPKDAAATPADKEPPARAAGDQPRKPTEAEVTSYLAAAAKYDDLDDVLFDPSLPWTKHMADAVSEEADAAELLYLLGQNPDELDRISKLSPKAQEREVWRFVDKKRAETAAASQTPADKPDGTAEAKPDAAPRAKAQPGPQVSKAAPVPAAQLSGGAAVSRRLEDLSDEEYIVEMNRREAERRRRA